MKRTRLRRRSIFVSWLLSYVLILLVPLGLTTVVYVVSIDVIEQQITRAHLASLGQVKHFLDSRFEDMDAVSVQIATNERVQSLALLRGEMLPIHRYNLLQVLDMLGNLRAANGFIEDIFVYYSELDMILSAVGRYREREFYDLFFEPAGHDFAGWSEMLSRRYSRDFAMLTRSTIDGESVDSFSVLHSIPLGNPFRQEATLVVSLTEETVVDAFGSIGWTEEGSGFIVDDEGRVLAAVGLENLAEPILRAAAAAPPGVSTINQGRKSYVTSSARSDVGPWRYVATLPSSIFLEQARYVRNLLLSAIIACMAIGFGISYVFSKRNYHPVEQLVKLVSTRPGNDSISLKNEFGFLQDSILEVLDENREMTQRLDRQKETLRLHFLSRLLKRQLPKTMPVDDALTMYGLRLTGMNCVIVIYVEGVQTPNGDDNLMDEGGGLERVRGVVSGVAREAVTAGDELYAFESDETLVCVLDLMQTEPDGAKREATEVAHRIRDAAERLAGIECRVAIGSPYAGIDRLSDSYEQALQTIEYGLIVGSAPVVRYDQLSLTERSHHLPAYSLEEEQRLINCIRAGDYANARDELDRIVEANFLSTATSLPMAKVRMSGLINTIINVLGEISVAFDAEFLSELDPVDRLLSAQSIQELRNEVRSILTRIEAYDSKRHGPGGGGMVERAIEHVREHFSDQSLNVSQLADLLEVNLTHLSRQFKRKTGLGLLDYIQRVRVEEAKRLLADSSESIKGVAESVGFYNSISFIRVFKKHEGITPGSYQKSRDGKKR